MVSTPFGPVPIGLFENPQFGMAYFQAMLQERQRRMEQQQQLQQAFLAAYLQQMYAGQSDDWREFVANRKKQPHFG